MHRQHLLETLADKYDDPLRTLLCEWLADDLPTRDTYPTTEHPSRTMNARLAEYVPNYGDEVYRIPLDATYYCAGPATIQDYMAHEWGDEREYVSDRYDCENFAFRFKALADVHGFTNVGVVVDWTSAHAYNIAVFPDRDPFLIEPQTDRTVDPGADDMHQLQDGVILL